MISKSISLFLVSLSLTLCMALSPAYASDSLSGATLKFAHVVNNEEGGDVSDAVFVKVQDNTRVSVNTGREYLVEVTANAVTVKFTRSQSWSDQSLFNGLVIDNISWPDAPQRKMIGATLDSAMTDVTDDILTVQGSSVLIDFRGLSAKQDDTLTLYITTSNGN